MDDHDRVCVHVSPGFCGFNCKVYAQKIDRHTVTVRIERSECKQIQRLAQTVTRLSIHDLFTALTKNPVFIGAEKAGCHPSCSIPTAILKASEAVLEMAVTSDVMIEFES